MSTIRRHYLYLVALLSILAALISTIATSWELIRLGVEGGALFRVLRTFWPGAAVAAWGLWGVHWFLAERHARPLTIVGATERAAAVRKAYLYCAQFVTLMILLAQAGLLVNTIIRRRLGMPLRLNLLPWPAWLIALIVGTILTLAVWAFLRWTAIQDGDFGHEIGAAAGWRRAYYYLAAWISFALVSVGAAESLRSVLRLVGRIFGLLPSTETPWWMQGTTWLTVLIVGVPFAIVIWRQIQRITFEDAAAELSSAARLVVRHTGALFGAAATLVSLVRLLQVVGMLLLGVSGQGDVGWEQMLIGPLAYLPVGIITWLAFSSGIRIDLEAGSGSAAVVAAARASRYLIAAVALAALSFGLAQLIRMVVLVALGMQPPVDRFAGWMRGGLSQAAALVLVAAPAWWGHWWPRHVQARQPGPAGRAERTSFERMFYLYGVLLVSALVILFNLAATVYNVVGTWRTGSVSASTFISLLGSGAFAAVALFWWIVHALVIRGDIRWINAEGEMQAIKQATVARYSEPREVGRQYPRDSLPSAPLPGQPSEPIDQTAARWTIAVIDGAEGLIGAALLAGLQQDLPGAILWPIGLNPVAQVTMLGALKRRTLPSVPDDALARVSLILGPSDILMPGGLGGDVSPEMAAAVASSPAKVLLLPPRASRLRWVGAPNWPREKWIEDAIKEAVAALTEP